MGELRNENLQDIEPEKSPEDVEIEKKELEKKCEKIAMEYITDLKKVGTLPIRFCFSGLVEENLKNGFSNNSFVINNEESLLDTNESITKNQNSSIFTQAAIGEAAHKNNYHLQPKQIEILKVDYPEIFQRIVDFLKIKTGKNISETDFSNLESFMRFRKDLLQATKELNIRLISPPRSNSEESDTINGYKNILTENCSTEQQLLVQDVAIKMITGVPIEEWDFELQELFIESIAKYFNKTMGSLAEQIYDMKIFIDPNQITEKKNGYLPGIEFNLTTPSESLLGIIIIGGILPKSYYVEKMKRLFKKYPNLSRPIYDNHGGLYWPKKMTNEEVKKMLEEKEKNKQK